MPCGKNENERRCRRINERRSLERIDIRTRNKLGGIPLIVQISIAFG